MKRPKSILNLVFVVAGLLAGAASAGAAEAPATDAAAQAYLQAICPGQPHQQLEALAGTWKASARFWPAPGAAPEQTVGLMSSRMVLGGRFLYSEYVVQSEAAAPAYIGVSYLGYDNLAGRYESVWMDTASTALLVVSGAMEEGGKLLRLSGRSRDPASGADLASRSLTRIASTDSYTYELFVTGPDGKEYKSLEVAYTRSSP